MDDTIGTIVGSNIPTPVPDTGYLFDRWKVVIDGETVYFDSFDDFKDLKPTADMTFWAMFMKEEDVKIGFYKGDHGEISGKT